MRRSVFSKDSLGTTTIDLGVRAAEVTTVRTILPNRRFTVTA